MYSDLCSRTSVERDDDFCEIYRIQNTLLLVYLLKAPSYFCLVLLLTFASLLLVTFPNFSYFNYITLLPNVSKACEENSHHQVVGVSVTLEY